MRFMKFIKIKLKNFRPYYDRTGEGIEIDLFNKKRINKNITLNVGPTGHGKTSISDAILWCLYGKYKYENWENMINTFAIDIAELNNDDTIEMSVELVLEINSKNYRIIRNGTYFISTNEKEDSIDVLYDGEPMDYPEEFIADNFPTIKLMEYFVFDADDILRKFEDNREGAIKDHINDIVGVGKLDKIISSMQVSIELYDEEIIEIEDEIDNETANKKKEKEKDLAKKQEAVKTLNNRIKKLEEKKKALFKRKPSSEVKKFTAMVEKRDKLEKDIINLNEIIIKSNSIPHLDLLLLEPIIQDTINDLNKKQTSKGEFDTATALIKSSLGNRYCGIIFDENEYLIKKKASINNKYLETTDSLSLESGEGIKGDMINTLNKYNGKIEEIKSEFQKYKVDYEDKKTKLIKVRNGIKQMGNTTKFKELKVKYKSFVEIEKKIKEKKENREEIQNKFTSLTDEIETLKSNLEYDEEQQEYINLIEEKKEYTKKLLEISKNTRKKFLTNLLSEVNSSASEFLKATVKDINRFHTIEIDSNYQFTVKQKNGDPLEENQINRGNLQLSMMAFFFGLSKFLEKEIPYVIDDPLIRLDPGHDKRLMAQLGGSNEQLILHLIPGKEYTTDSYKWMCSHINSQNWIYRTKYKRTGHLTSFVESKDPIKMIKFDIDNL